MSVACVMYHADAYNWFVDVVFDQSTSNITCVFYREVVEHYSNNTCTVMYAPEANCEKRSQHYWMSPLSDTVITDMPEVTQDVVYCFTVVASSGDFTVVVEGRFDAAGIVYIYIYMSWLQDLN